MAINNWINYSQAPLQESPTANLFENLLKGYKMGQEPARMAAEAKDKALATQLKQLEAEHKPTEYELSDKQKTLANALQEEALKYLPEKRRQEALRTQAYIDKANRVTASGGIKPSGDVANSIYLSDLAAQLGTDHPKYIAAKEAFERGQKNKESLITNRQAYGNSIGWRSLPAENKRHEIALATGMGYDPSAAEQDLASGKTLDQLAKDKNVDINNLIPVYPVGAENIKQTQRRGAFVQELSSLDKHIAEGLGKYQNKIAGFSLQQVADAVANDKPEIQGKVLAARALAPELAALRLKVAGGNIGIEALRELQDKSLSNLRLLESTVSPEAYAAMNRYIDKWLVQANDKYTNAINDYGRLNVGKPNLASGGKVFNLSTGSYE